jgi:hypothetical protein
MATGKVQWVRLHFALSMPCAAIKRIVIKSYDLADAINAWARENPLRKPVLSRTVTNIGRVG